MGTISSGTGLISGLDIQSLVTQLMAIESRPLDLLKSRITETQKEQTAYMELNARLLAIKSVMSRLARPSSFTKATATSSAPEVLSATATGATPRDTYSFQVASLVTTHQLVSSGFADRDSTPVGTGSLTFEAAKSRVNPSTPLSALNNFRGVRRGSIRITDRSGDSAVIDLGHALNVDDVLEAINSQTGIAVKASAQGGRIVLTDESGGNVTPLRVQDVNGGFAAVDLGIAGSDGDDGTVDGVINGHNVLALSELTNLSHLNDGMGVRVDGVLDDLRFTLKDGRQINVNLSNRLQFTTKLAVLNDGRGVRDEGGQRIIRITDRTGTSADIDLSSAQTIQDVQTAISTSGLSVGISLSGSKIIVSDNSGEKKSNLIIKDVQGHAAFDLGIEADVAEISVAGKNIYNVDTLADVLRAVKYAGGNTDTSYPDGALTVSVSGNTLVVTDHTTGTATTTVESLHDSKAIHDLGLLAVSSGETVVSFDGDTLASRDLIANLNTVLLSSLQGGRGIETGTVQFTLRDGTTTGPVDFTDAKTLQDVIDKINALTGLSAEVDTGGSGIIIKDTTQGNGTLQATDLTGSTIASLGLTSASANQLASGDLHLRYIGENTLVSGLNQEKGISFGKFQITDSRGQTRTATLTQQLHQTVGDVIDAINSLGIGVVARINSNGDGIELQDTAGGTGTLTVTEASGGSTAASLGILGTANSGVLTGSFAKTIEIDSDDTLDELVEKINSANAGVSASIVNDGTAYAPYRLILTSKTSGTKGSIVYSSVGTAFSLDTLTKPKDAAVILGNPNSPNAILLTSSTNTITDVVPGLTLNLLGTSTQPVSVKVDGDVESVVNDVKSFVSSFNDALDRMDEYTKYIPDTNQQGVLLGDGAVLRVRDQLYRTVTGVINDPEFGLKRLFDVGISVGSGARLQLDEDKLRAAFKEDPTAFRKFFTKVDIEAEKNTVNVGFAAKFNKMLDELTNTQIGSLAQQNKRLQERVDLFNQRAKDMQILLDQKEDRLYAQFQAMERALADMQAQQSSLGVLSNMASSFSIGGTSRSS